MPNPRRTRTRATPALLLFIAFLPACFTGLLIIKYGVDIPHADEWETALLFEKFAQGTLSFRDLFAQQNEYRQIFPHLIFLTLGWLTKWNVRYETLISFLLACLTSFNIYRLGKQTAAAAAGRSGRLWTYIIINLLIFSPVQYSNWLYGQQLIYFIPIACVTTCLLAAYSDSLCMGTKFLICASLSTVSTFSSANGILCWVVVAPVFLWSSSWDELSRKRWWALGWAIGIALNVTLYFHDYHKPAQHPELSDALYHPSQAGIYFLSLLGRPLTLSRVVMAATAGAILVTLFAWSCLHFLRFLRDTSDARRMIGWLMVGAYSILTAVMVTVGRLGFGVETSLTSRYTTFTLYLAVSLVHLVPLVLDAAARRKDSFGNRFPLARMGSLLAVILIIAHVPIYLLGIRQMSSSGVALLQSKACVLFVNVVRDECLTKKVNPDYEALKRRINSANRLGFLRPGVVNSARVQDFAGTGAQDSDHFGSFQSLININHDEYVASGWAVLRHRGEPADAVLLAYESADGALVFALAELEIERDFVSAMLRRGIYADASWRKTFSIRDLPVGAVELTAWAFDTYTGKAYRLDGTHVIRTSSSRDEP